MPWDDLSDRLMPNVGSGTLWLFDHITDGGRWVFKCDSCVLAGVFDNLLSSVCHNQIMLIECQTLSAAQNVICHVSCSKDTQGESVWMTDWLQGWEGLMLLNYFQDNGSGTLLWCSYRKKNIYIWIGNWLLIWFCGLGDCQIHRTVCVFSLKFIKNFLQCNPSLVSTNTLCLFPLHLYPSCSGTFSLSCNTLCSFSL